MAQLLSNFGADLTGLRQGASCAAREKAPSFLQPIRVCRHGLVGLRNTSPKEIVGKVRGNAPAARTPRATASASSGTWRWQLLKSDGVTAMPTTGLPSSSLETPIERAIERLRKLANSGSP